MKMKFWKKDNHQADSNGLKMEDMHSHIESLEAELDDFSVKGYESTSVVTMGSSPEYASDTFLQTLYNTEGWVHIAINAVAKQIAQLPIVTEKRFLQEETVIQPNGEEIKLNKYVWMREDIPKYYDVLKEPNPDFSMMELTQILTVDLLSTGSAFLFKNIQSVETNNPRDRVRAAMGSDINYTLHRVNPTVMTVVRSKETGLVEGFNMTNEETTYFFKASEIVWLKLPNPTDPDKGLSPLMPILQKITLERFKDEHIIRFYKQGARLGGVIKTSKNLTKDQVNRLERTFEANYTGKKNFHRTLILPNGMDYKTIESEPTGQSLKQIQDSNKEQILSVFGVPPIKVGLLDGATYDNAETQNKTFYKDTISPLYKLMADKLNSKNIILSETDNRIAFDISEVEELQSDSQAKGEIARGMIATGLSINEVRDRVWNLGAVEHGEIVPALHKLIVAEAYSGANPENDPNNPDNDPTNNPNQVNGEDGVIGGQNRTEDVNQDVDMNNEDEKSLSDAANVQNDTEALSSVVSTTTTFAERVEELMIVAIGQGVDPKVAVRTAIEQAISEGLVPVTVLDLGQEEKKNSIYLDKFGEEKLKEYQSTTTGVGVDDLIEQRRLYYTNRYASQIRSINEWIGKDVSAKGLVKAVDDPSSLVLKKIAIDLALGFIVGEFSDEYAAVLAISQIDGGIFSILNASLKLALVNDAKKIAEVLAPDINTTDVNTEALNIGFTSAFPSVGIDFPVTTAQSSRLSSLAEQITYVDTTTIEQVKRIIDNAIVNEYTIDEVAADLNDQIDIFDIGRSKVIARTEVLTDVSVGHDLKRDEVAETFPNIKSKMKKMWVTARDNRVRDSHDYLDGITVGKDELFPNGLKYPRDPAGTAEEVVNCRCAVIDFIEDDRESIDSIFGNESQTDLFNGLFR